MFRDHIDRFVLALGAVATFGLFASAVTAGEGKAGFISPWVEMPISARAAALGDAFSAVADGAMGHLYNPAAIAETREATLATSYRAMHINRKLGYAGAVFPLREEASVALSWRYADFGNTERRSNVGQRLDGTIGQDEHYFSLAFAKQFSRRVAIGGSGSLYQFKVDDITTNTVILDAGVMFYIDHFLYDRETIGQGFLTDIQAAVVVKQIGSSRKLNTGKYWERRGKTGSEEDREVPRKVVIGASARAFDRQALITGDVEFHQALGARGRVGVEYELVHQLTLRAGTNRTAPTAGVGFNIDVGKTLMVIDYAFQADRVDEGSEHVVSIEVSF